MKKKLIALILCVVLLVPMLSGCGLAKRLVNAAKGFLAETEEPVEEAPVADAPVANDAVAEAPAVEAEPEEWVEAPAEEEPMEIWPEEETYPVENDESPVEDDHFIYNTDTHLENLSYYADYLDIEPESEVTFNYAYLYINGANVGSVSYADADFEPIDDSWTEVCKCVLLLDMQEIADADVVAEMLIDFVMATDPTLNEGEATDIIGNTMETFMANVEAEGTPDTSGDFYTYNGVTYLITGAEDAEYLTLFCSADM